MCLLLSFFSFFALLLLCLVHMSVLIREKKRVMLLSVLIKIFLNTPPTYSQSFFFH